MCALPAQGQWVRRPAQGQWLRDLYATLNLAAPARMVRARLDGGGLVAALHNGENVYIYIGALPYTLL